MENGMMRELTAESEEGGSGIREGVGSRDW